MEMKKKNEDIFLIGVTGCPTGVAHTYIAAETLKKAAEKRNISIKVETNGSIGVEDSPSDEEIERADAVIVACDKQVDLDRFSGKRVLFVPIKKIVKGADETIDRILNEEIPVYKEELVSTTTATGKKMDFSSARGNIYKYLMNGVSHMIPFVIVGGILIALSLALGGKPTPQGLQIPEGSRWNSILNIGVLGFKLMIPILAGYIAYAIGDRPALAPGIIGGWIANDGSFYNAPVGTGFIGAIIAGFLVGYFVLFMKKFKWPKMLQPLLPIMIIPITGTLFIGAVFIFIIGAPIAALMTNMTNVLISLSSGSIILIGLVMGLMQGFDMGGPFGKVVLLFNLGLLASGQTLFMGAQACAIPVAPLGMALATFIGRKLFSEDEFENGKAAFAMGLVGISEGAIPFAAADPISVFPANMIGSAVACIAALLFGVTCSVAHGGPIILLLGAVNKPFLGLLAMILGAVTTAAISLGIKTVRYRKRALVL